MKWLLLSISLGFLASIFRPNNDFGRNFYMVFTSKCLNPFILTINLKPFDSKKKKLDSRSCKVCFWPRIYYKKLTPNVQLPISNALIQFQLDTFWNVHLQAFKIFIDNGVPNFVCWIEKIGRVHLSFLIEIRYLCFQYDE